MISKYKDAISSIDSIKHIGKVTGIKGLIIESIGPHASVNELCKIYNESGEEFYGEVISVEGKKTTIMPYTEVTNLSKNCYVVATGEPLLIGLSDGVLGRVVNCMGQPIDNKNTIYANERRSVFAPPPPPIDKKPIDTQFSTGVKSIDSFMSVGMGQRLGIFAGSGVGKSTLLGMIAKNTNADVNVIALVGERGREILEFIEKDLGDEGMARSVIVTATSSEPPLSRIRGAFTATTIAEYFRDQGKNVMLLFDSITRFAKAQREIGLSIGEAPAMRGYPPSVFSEIPKILERAGTSKHGSITAFYTVLVDGDDMDEPISDTVRGILDGHIILSRKLANAYHYPAIDVLASLSRLATKILDKERVAQIGKLRNLMAVYKEKEDLISIGAYVRGSNPQVDKAIAIMPILNKFLMQDMDTGVDLEKTWRLVKKLNSYL